VSSIDPLDRSALETQASFDSGGKIELGRGRQSNQALLGAKTSLVYQLRRMYAFSSYCLQHFLASSNLSAQIASSSSFLWYSSSNCFNINRPTSRSSSCLAEKVVSSKLWTAALRSSKSLQHPLDSRSQSTALRNASNAFTFLFILDVYTVKALRDFGSTGLKKSNCQLVHANFS